MSETPFSPPESISHDDWVAALRPLMALCGTTPEATFVEGMRIVPHKPNDGYDDVLQVIEFMSAIDPEDGTEPVEVGDDPEFSESGWPIRIAVI